MAQKIASENKRKNYSCALENIREHIHSTFEFDGIVKGIIKETATAVSCETASIILRQGDIWVISYAYGFPEEMVGMCLSESELSLVNMAVKTKNVVAIKDACNDQNSNIETARQWDTHSVLILPLVIEDEVIGILLFNYNNEVRHFSKPLLDFAANIASYTSYVLKNRKVLNELAERKKTEEKLKYINFLNIEILENMSDGFISLDRDWRYRYVNRRAADNTGVEPEYLINKSIWEEYPGLKGTLLEASYRKAMAEQVTVSFEFPDIVTGKFYHCNACPTEEGILVYWMDITERKKQQEKVLNAEREKNEALQKTIEMKDEFLSLISHEFKTPLTVINSAIQAMKLLCRDELSGKANNFLNKILQNSNRQLKLVNNLLDITRINAGQLKINKVDLDIVLLTKSITESIRIFAEQKGISLSFSSTLMKKVTGMDGEKYERILLNLLSNAIKFTPKGKSVSVRVSQKVVSGKCMVCIQVRDHGVGIPSDKMDVIFERFGQVDSSLSRQAEGTGIGLHLVKMFVELLDGKIMLDSRLGKGSTFTLLFPIHKVNSTPIEHMIREISDNRLIQATSIEFSDVYL